MSRRKQPVKPVNKQAQATQHSRQPQPLPVRAELHIPPAITDAYDAYKKEQTARDMKVEDSQKKALKVERFKAAVEFLGLLGVAATFYVAYQQWQTMRNTLDAANEQVKIAKKQMKTSVRPWVALDDGRGNGLYTTPIHFDEKGNAQLKYRIFAKNFGTSGAQNVQSIAFLLVTEDLAVITKQREYACDRYVGSEDRGFVLFSGVGRAGTESAGFYSRAEMVSSNSSGEVQAWMAGCIGYRDQFGDLYHSSFIYRFLDPSTQRPVMIKPGVTLTDVAGVFSPYRTSIGVIKE